MAMGARRRKLPPSFATRQYSDRGFGDGDINQRQEKYEWDLKNTRKRRWTLGKIGRKLGGGSGGSCGWFGAGFHSIVWMDRLEFDDGLTIRVHRIRDRTAKSGKLRGRRPVVCV
jgi:hypothetical protein